MKALLVFQIFQVLSKFFLLYSRTKKMSKNFFYPIFLHLLKLGKSSSHFPAWKKLKNLNIFTFKEENNSTFLHGRVYKMSKKSFFWCIYT